MSTVISLADLTGKFVEPWVEAHMTHIPIPVGVVVHQPPKVVTPKPLPALTTGSRDYQRKWALSHGMQVALVGALPKAVLEAYQEALG